MMEFLAQFRRQNQNVEDDLRFRELKTWLAGWEALTPISVLVLGFYQSGRSYIEVEMCLRARARLREKIAPEGQANTILMIS